jgi:HK97 family phage prohead protease
MDTTKMTRAFDSKLQNLRAVDDEKRTIEGYAIVFNERSLPVLDWNLWKRVTEIISPDAITDDLLRSSDVIANIEHNDGRMLARCVNGVGSLSLSKDNVGILVRFDAPDTPDGHTAYEGVKRRDFTGMSFAYRNDDDECNVTYTKEGEGEDAEIIRTVNKIDHLYDVAIVLHPAYPATSVEARNAEHDFLEKEIKRSLEIDEAPKTERSSDMMRDFDELDKFINS